MTGGIAMPTGRPTPNGPIAMQRKSRRSLSLPPEPSDASGLSQLSATTNQALGVESEICHALVHPEITR